MNDELSPITRPPSLGPDERRLIIENPELFANRVIEELQGLNNLADRIDPEFSQSVGGTVFIPGAGGGGGPVAPSGIAGGLEVANTINVAVGELVSYAAGVLQRADFRQRQATHAVGKVKNGKAVLYCCWASGPLQVSGGLDSPDPNKVRLYLGVNGKASVGRPPVSNSENIEQVVGMRLESSIQGTLTCQLNISNNAGWI